MNAALSLFRLLVVASALVACQSAPESTSSLFVISGNVVTDPSQAPGTYGMSFYVGDQLVGNASAVAVGNDTLLTSGHVVAGPEGVPIDRIVIRDYQGNEVHSFDPNAEGVSALVHPDFAKNGNIQNDIGAYVFDTPIPDEQLTHGVASVSASRSEAAQDVYLVGNGVQDYDTLENPNPETTSGTMRYGSNEVAGTDEGGFWIEGVAGVTEGGSEQAVSGPGDSGGGAFVTSEDGSRQLVGLMEGGGQIEGQENAAASYVVDVTTQQDFLQQVQRRGGSVEGYDFSDQKFRGDPSYDYSRSEAESPAQDGTEGSSSGTGSPEGSSKAPPAASGPRSPEASSKARPAQSGTGSPGGGSPGAAVDAVVAGAKGAASR